MVRKATAGRLGVERLPHARRSEGMPGYANTQLTDAVRLYAKRREPFC